ncbi:hypothetical protein LTR99_010968 [Exophiala xenobiotica]|uniref:Uncharacterized protein n=1 Tax=Vermiconidia calcicola TaxID=1690605 RepID=A0AAV9QGV3_9PEZI|nr:hypothetical protein LTR47_010878 [Exophiala xenobiotica]KAK5531180.1 hypothetical protein LTR23_010043 [Chaetothyriales sp. CCFEE 6169]KAK5541369.1 hypothetical protein LTR25_003146 [Vermiconidia calcicola]KAK5246963.1 hypothetical protein LTS06_007816 [Exophiala xenobiotica]KAK5261832.1 hypothetical protein LTR40_001468 [Exophiala xenobiotica]
MPFKEAKSRGDTHGTPYGRKTGQLPHHLSGLDSARNATYGKSDGLFTHPQNVSTLDRAALSLSLAIRNARPQLGKPAVSPGFVFEETISPTSAYFDFDAYAAAGKGPVEELRNHSAEKQQYNHKEDEPHRFGAFSRRIPSRSHLEGEHRSDIMVERATEQHAWKDRDIPADTFINEVRNHSHWNDLASQRRTSDRVCKSSSACVRLHDVECNPDRVDRSPSQDIRRNIEESTGSHQIWHAEARSVSGQGHGYSTMEKGIEQKLLNPELLPPERPLGISNQQQVDDVSVIHGSHTSCSHLHLTDDNQEGSYFRDAWNSSFSPKI